MAVAVVILLALNSIFNIWILFSKYDENHFVTLITKVLRYLIGAALREIETTVYLSHIKTWIIQVQKRKKMRMRMWIKKLRVKIKKQETMWNWEKKRICQTTENTQTLGGLPHLRNHQLSRTRLRQDGRMF